VRDPHLVLAELARRWTPSTSLVPALAPDALVSWIDAAADRGDDEAVRAAVPRLLQLAVADQLDPIPTWEALGHLDRAGWRDWPLAQRAAVEEVLDGWWRATLIGHPSRPDAHEVLVAQAVVRRQVRPLLDLWLAELDGSGAIHLAEVVRDDLDPGAGELVHAGWAGLEDLSAQVVAWARSEAVIVGLTLVGGPHLDRELLSDALDQLI
jgi:hypothetical protein